MPEDKTTILIEQYKIATDLYKHEDNLNWKKLNNLLYVNASFFAVSGLIIRHITSGNIAVFSQQTLLGLISVVGIIVSIIFGTALFFGKIYLGLRKKAAINIEEHLAGISGQYIISPKFHNDRGYAEKSPTGWMLLLIPILLFLFWLIVLITIVRL